MEQKPKKNCGEVEQTIVEGKHIPIVTKDEFEQVLKEVNALMLSDADVIREGFNANISSISHVASYLVIPENPESMDFDNKLYMIFKVTGSDYMNDNLISFVTIRLTNVRESSHIESLDYYLIPYGKTSVGSSYAEHIEPYEKECYIESKEYTQ